MKRYFDVNEQRLTLEIDFSEDATKQPVEKIEEAIGMKGLTEINKEEFERLTCEYTRPIQERG